MGSGTGGRIAVQYAAVEAAAASTRSAAGQVNAADAAHGCGLAAGGIPGAASASLLGTVGDDLTAALTTWRRSAEGYARGLDQAAALFRGDESKRTTANTAFAAGLP